MVIIENRAVYDLEDDVPEEPVAIPFGKGRIVREGTDVTIVGASLMAYEALRAAAILSEQHGISAEVIDPRSIRPLDEEIILQLDRQDPAPGGGRHEPGDLRLRGRGGGRRGREGAWRICGRRSGG